MTNSANLSHKFRQDFAIIAGWVNFGSKVLDLGCGDGELLTYLRGSLEVKGYGVEKDDTNWLACLQNGTNVIQMDLEDGLSGFEDQSFDTVVLSQTLQAMHNTEEIVQEMLRVGAKLSSLSQILAIGVIAFKLPAATCQSPKLCRISGLIRPMCIFAPFNDFDQFCKNHNITVIERKVITDGNEVNFMPNLLGNLAMYRPEI